MDVSNSYNSHLSYINRSNFVDSGNNFSWFAQEVSNDDYDCGFCEKCVSDVCEFQITLEDTKDDCSDYEARLTGYCDGANAC